MTLLSSIALRHLLARKRQSVVSLSGIIIGVAFFLAISSMMIGSQKDFIRLLVDNAPHITITDTYRHPGRQPLEMLYPDATVEIRNVKPLTETRGIRGYRQILETVRVMPNVRATAVLTGQALLSFAGRDVSIVLNGMVPADIAGLTTIEEDMVQGSIDDLVADRNGIIIGQALLEQMALDMGDNITLAAATGQVRTFKIVGTFHTGLADYDETQAFVDLKRVQALLDRPNRANTIIIKLDDEQRARELAASIERRIGYKTVSWQEKNENILNTLIVRNVIMYVVVSAVLLVAAFGIYNTISTVVMEKHRDIAILKSIGFRPADIRQIFLIEAIFLGLAGIAAGLPLGSLMIYGLGFLTFHPPDMDPLTLPMDWSPLQFIIAGGFAMLAALLAAWMPANKGAKVMPVDVLRGGQ